MEQTKVILYSRVGKEEEATTTSGTSLERQQKIMSKYCKERQLNPVAHFSDAASPDTFDRPGFNEMLAFIGNNEQGISQILVTSGEKFSGSPSEALSMLYQLRLSGIEVKAINQAVIEERYSSTSFRKILFEYARPCFIIHKNSMPEFAAIIGETILEHRIECYDDDYILVKVTYNRLNDAESYIVKQLSDIEASQGKVHGITDSHRSNPLN